MPTFQPQLPGPDLLLTLDRRLTVAAVNLTCRLAPCRKHPANPLPLDGQPVWRQDNLAGLIRFLPHEQRLWGNIGNGLSQDNGPRPRNAVQSRDGIEWQACEVHPDLYRLPGDPDERCPYKGIIKVCDSPLEQNQEWWHLNHGGRLDVPPVPGIGVARSSDAVQWQIFHPILRQTAPLHTVGTDLWGGGDGYNHLVYLPQRRQYACYVRTNINRQAYGGRKERAVSLLLSDDFVNWSPQQVVLRPWTDLHAACGDGKYDFYHLPVFRYGQIYLSVVSVFRWELDTVHLELTWSPDGVHWDRVCPGQEFIPQAQGQEAIDSGCNFACQEPILCGQEMWLYYGASKGRHNRDPGRVSGMCLAIFGRDRFAGLQPDRWDRPATWRSAAVTVGGSTLQINVDAAGGAVRVGLRDEQGQPLPGFTLADCQPVLVDAVRHEVAWRGGGSLASLLGRKLALDVTLDRATLFAFQFKA